MILTPQQRQALHRVWLRHPSGLTYRQFRRTVQSAIGLDCIFVPWAGMWLGIETDGYTHS